MIVANSWCRIVNGKKMKGSGLETGDEVYVMGEKLAPATRSDPYLRRVYVLVCPVRGDNLILPTPSNDVKSVLIDPRNLETVSEERKQQLETQLKLDYGEDI